MEEIRERLLEAAGQVFAQRGFRAATIREISGLADANVAAVNYYFGDKEQLYRETVRLASRQRATEVPFPVWTEETPGPTKLRDFVATVLERMLGQGEGRWESSLMLREVLHPTEACRELVEDYFRPVFETLIGIIEELVPGQQRHRYRQLALSVMGQCLIYRAAGEVIAMITAGDEGPPPMDVRQLASHIADFSLSALGHGNAMAEGSTIKSSTSVR